MSDHTVIESIIRQRDLHLTIRHSHARRFLSESPLHASSLGSLATMAPGRVPPAQIGRGNWANLIIQGVRPTMSLVQGAIPQTPNGTANPTATVAPVNREPKKPMTTVLSLLPKTTYREEKGAEGTQDVLAYLKVQQELLGYLGIRTADSLTPQQACQWTESILPDKKPRPQDALRLCYYMRLQSLDTYADVKDGFISLYVANPNMDVRGQRTDMLYWRQSIKTNEIVFRGVNAPVVVPDPMGMADFYTLMNVPTTPRAHVPVRAANNVGPEDGHVAEELVEEAVVDEEDDGEADEVQTDGEEHNGAAAQNTLAMQVERAEAHVYRLLGSEPYNADAVNAALMQLEELNRHLHAE